MRSLQTLYPSYKARVNLVIVSEDLGESPQKLQSYSDQEGWKWDVYLGNEDIFQAYRITSQDTKLVINKDGVIVSREGYRNGVNWRKLLDSVAGG